MLALVVLSACEPGEVVGPPGPEGPPGPQGPSGSANVQSITFALRSDDFVIQSEALATYQKLVPEITPEIVESGVVLAYTDLGGTVWRSLPLGPLGYAFGAGSFWVIVESSIDVSALVPFYDEWNVRVVLIPPGSDLLGRQSMDGAGYEELVQRYHPGSG